MAPYTYSLYGVHVRTQLPIPGLPAGDETEGAPDVSVRRFGAVEPDNLRRLIWQRLEGCPRGEAYLQTYQAHTREGTFVQLLVISPFDDGHIRFIIAPDGKTVWCSWSAIVPWFDVAGLLVKMVLSMALRLQGRLALHTSAVSIGGRALLLLGGHGAGKSTTAAALCRAGHRILADDMVTLGPRGDRYLVYPGFPELRLRDDAAAIYGDPRRMLPLWKRASPAKEKARMLLPAEAMDRQPRPLAALVVLCPAPRNGHSLTRLKPPQALIALVPHVYGRDLSHGRGEGHEFQEISRLARDVPCLQLRRPHDLGQLPHIVTELTRYVSALEGLEFYDA